MKPGSRSLAGLAAPRYLSGMDRARKLTEALRHPSVAIDRLLHRAGLGREIFYRAHGLGAGAPVAPVVVLALEEALAMLDREGALGTGGAAAYHRARDRGAQAVGVRGEAGEVVQVCFCKPAEARELPPWLAGSPPRTWLVANAHTARAARGAGLYPLVLRGIISLTPLEERIVIFTDAWNRASRRGIAKAGFTPIGVRQSLRGRAPAWRRVRQ